MNTDVTCPPTCDCIVEPFIAMRYRRIVCVCRDEGDRGEIGVAVWTVEYLELMDAR
jgi:hypothetical protein